MSDDGTRDDRRRTGQEPHRGLAPPGSGGDTLGTACDGRRAPPADDAAEIGRFSTDLRDFLATTGIAALFLDRQLRVTRFTPAAPGDLGLDPSDLGRPISDVAGVLGGLADDAAEVLRGRGPVQRELRTDDGRWQLARILPHRTTDDRNGVVVVTVVDITPQKHAEERLRASERLFRSTAEHLPLLVWVSDPAGRFTWVNTTYSDFVGRPRDVAVREGWRPLVHPDDVDDFAARFDRANSEQSELHDESRMRHADGSWRWIETWAQPRFDAQGRFIGHLGTSADITARRRAHDALRSTAEQAAVRAELLDTLRPLDDPVAIQAAAARIVNRHLGASRVHYATIDESGRWGIVEADHSPHLPSVVGRHRFDSYGTIIRDGLRQGRVTVVEDVTTDGRLDDRQRAATLSLGARSYAIVPLARDGRVLALMVAHQSTPRRWRPSELAVLEEALTRTWSAVERAEALRAVQLSEERLRYVLDAVPSVLFTTDRTGCVDMAIGQLQSILGTDATRVTGTVMWPDLISDHDRPRVVATWDRARSAGAPFEARYRIATTGRWVMVRSVPIRDDHGHIVQWFGTITDVDALITAEQALAEINDTLEQRVLEGVVRARELASSLSRAEHDERRRLGQMLHDDLQQVLYSLQLKLGTARDGLVDDADGATAARLADIQERLERAIEITRNLTIDLSPPLLENDDLQVALQWLESYMADLHDLGVTVEFDDPFDVDDDLKVMLFHIARELLFNVAKHAGTDHATVRVEQDDGDLLLVVADRGLGFDPDELRAADGIGLSHVRERLQLLSGHLDIRSRPGAGCTITARIPLREDQRGDASGG